MWRAPPALPLRSFPIANLRMRERSPTNPESQIILSTLNTHHSPLANPLASLGDRPIIVDIGGEGRYRRAWNLNPRSLKTLGPDRGRTIPRHIPGRAEAIPLPNGSVDLVIVERTPLRLAALQEIARIVSDNGVVILRHALPRGRDCHALARQIIPALIARRIVQLGTQRVQESIFSRAATNAAGHDDLLASLADTER